MNDLRCRVPLDGKTENVDARGVSPWSFTNRTRTMKTGKITILFLAFISLLLAVFVYPKIFPASGYEKTVTWSEDFSAVFEAGESQLPENWTLKKKPGTPPAVFSVENEGNGKDESYLHMEADKASGSLVTYVDDVELAEAPSLKWRWRAETLPEGADGRNRKKDDQAIGIYVGSGSVLNNKSVSYRWDTDTPKGTEGRCVYGGGTVNVKWFTLRNKEDAGGGQWFTEERNVAEDYKEAWGYYPKKIYLSVSCNSQYTGTMAAADLAWIEFVPITGKNTALEKGGK